MIFKWSSNRRYGGVELTYLFRRWLETGFCGQHNYILESHNRQEFFNIWETTISSRTRLHGVSFVCCTTFLSSCIYVPPLLLGTAFSFVTRAHCTVNSAITCELELPIRWYPILPVHIRAPGSSPDRWVVLYSAGVKSAARYNGSQPGFTVTEPDFQSRYKLHFSFFGKSLQKTSIWMM